MMTAAVSGLPLPLGTLLFIAAGACAVVESGLRFRRPGGNALLAILQLVLGLLLLVATLPLVHPYISTTLQPLWLAVGLAVVLLLELLIKRARKSGILWLTIVTLLLAGAAAVVSYFHVA